MLPTVGAARHAAGSPLLTKLSSNAGRSHRSHCSTTAGPLGHIGSPAAERASQPLHWPATGSSSTGSPPAARARPERCPARGPERTATAPNAPAGRPDDQGTWTSLPGACAAVVAGRHRGHPFRRRQRATARSPSITRTSRTRSVSSGPAARPQGVEFRFLHTLKESPAPSTRPHPKPPPRSGTVVSPEIQESCDTRMRLPPGHKGTDQCTQPRSPREAPECCTSTTRAPSHSTTPPER